jgi:hypothetical protein
MQIGQRGAPTTTCDETSLDERRTVMVDRRLFLARTVQSVFALVTAPLVAVLHPRNAKAVPDDTDPLVWLRRVEQGEIEAPDDDVYVTVMHENAIRATDLHSGNRRAWRYRASHGWLRAMCTTDRNEQVHLFGDIIEAGHRLMELGASLNAEEVWCDAVRYPSDAVFSALDKRFALTELGKRLHFFEVNPARRDRIGPRSPLRWDRLISLREAELASA